MAPPVSLIRRPLGGILLFVVFCFVLSGATSGHPSLLLVVFDGFRWDYLNRFDVPTFRSVEEIGVRANRVINVMPTMTSASHYTMLTGLYPESHGLVLNSFYDPDFGYYDLFEPEHQTQSHWFDTGAEPLWVTNQKSAKDRYSASLMWPTALASVKGASPTYHRGPLFNVKMTNESRIDQMIDWFLDPLKPANLGLLYFDEPDLIGHMYGPDSVQVKNTVEELDKVLHYLIARLKRSDLYDKVNIILTADHGMSHTPRHQFINITEFVPTDLYDCYGEYSIVLIKPKPGKEEEVFSSLRQAQQKYPHLKVLRKSDYILKALNYSRNDRISPIVLLADEGWFIVNKEEQLVNPDRGTHGYLPTLANMNPFFIAAGPSFKEGYFTESIRSIDFYELMCHILEIQPSPNNGSLANIKHILKSEQDNVSKSGNVVVKCIVGVVFVVTVFLTLPVVKSKIV